MEVQQTLTQAQDPTLPELNILVVEDDECLRVVVERTFQSLAAQVKVDWATTAQEAVERLYEADYMKLPFDLVLADIFLPNLCSGVEVAEFCNENLPKTQILLMSSMPSDQYLQLFQRNHLIPCFIHKPFRTSELRKVVEVLLNDRIEGPI